MKLCDIARHACYQSDQSPQHISLPADENQKHNFNKKLGMLSNISMYNKNG